MDPSDPNDALDCRIVRIDKAILQGQHPRPIGHNARIGHHGSTFSDPILRIHTEDGAVGIGCSRANRAEAEALLGRSVQELFRLPEGSTPQGQVVDLPLWDWAARRLGQPLYQLLGARGRRDVEVYDGAIYIDDLGKSDAEAVEIFRREVETGLDYGFRAFKVKIGRGARWMAAEEGMARDVLVIRTVRDAAGPAAKVLVDANMGNTLNTAKRLLTECEGVGIHWFEEPFAEDKPINEAFKEFIRERGWSTLVADGEFAPPRNFFDMVQAGSIDVVQHDLRAYGLTWWRATAARIEPWGALCGPHTWGSHFERYAHAHFAASVPNYALLEAAPSPLPGLVLHGWDLREGKLHVPDAPGIGVDVEPAAFEAGMAHPGGFCVEAGRASVGSK